MKKQFSIGLFTFILIVAIILFAPNVETAVVLITAIVAFVSINNHMFEYLKNKKIEDSENMDNDESFKSALKSSIKNSNIAGEEYDSEYFGEINTDDGESVYVDGAKVVDNQTVDKVNPDATDTELDDIDTNLGADESAEYNSEKNKQSINIIEEVVLPSDKALAKMDLSKNNVDEGGIMTTDKIINVNKKIAEGNKLADENVKRYNYNLEYTPDKVGNVRQDYEKMVHNKQSYTRCYKPIVDETNDCDLYSHMTLDEHMSKVWREKGLRDKKAIDGQMSKKADYYRTYFNTELDESERKCWWEISDNY